MTPFLVSSVAHTLSLPWCRDGPKLIRGPIPNPRDLHLVMEEIDKARSSVHFETFLWKEGKLGSRLSAALIGRVRAGVDVRVLLDANGTRGMGKGVEQQLVRAGCKLRKFHRTTLANIGVLNERDHRKLAIIDGRVAFVGGHCIVDSWLAEEGAKERVMDVSVRLRGPIVHSMQSAFSENWVGQTGELFMGERVFPPLERAGDIAIHAAFVKPESSAPAVKILHHAAICCARRRIWIQNPYFLPEPAAIDALGAAVKRGVDVRVLMPSTSGSDNPMVQHAGHRNFEKLLRCGVRLIEYPTALLHQKIMTIDGLWCAVGTANFDDRSFEVNDEVSEAVLDHPSVQEYLDGVRDIESTGGHTLESFIAVFERITSEHDDYLEALVAALGSGCADRTSRRRSARTAPRSRPESATSPARSGDSCNRPTRSRRSSPHQILDIEATEAAATG